MTEIIDTFLQAVREPISSLKVGSIFRSNSSNCIYIKVDDGEYFNMTNSAVGNLFESFTNYTLASTVEVRYD